MFELNHKAACRVEGVDEGGIDVILLVDLETQVITKDVI